MLAAGDEGRLKLGKIIIIVTSLVVVVPLLLVSIGFIIAGFLADPTALTDDGFSLRMFFFIMGAAFFAGTIGTVALMGGILFIFRLLTKGVQQRQRLMEELQERGLKGTATVVELIDTGMLVNYNPRVKLVLDVVVERQAPYRISKTETIPMTRLPQIQPGQTIEVLVDPNDRQNPDRVVIRLK